MQELKDNETQNIVLGTEQNDSTLESKAEPQPSASRRKVTIDMAEVEARSSLGTYSSAGSLCLAYGNILAGTPINPKRWVLTKKVAPPSFVEIPLDNKKQVQCYTIDVQKLLEHVRLGIVLLVITALMIVCIMLAMHLHVPVILWGLLTMIELPMLIATNLDLFGVGLPPKKTRSVSGSNDSVADDQPPSASSASSASSSEAEVHEVPVNAAAYAGAHGLSS